MLRIAIVSSYFPSSAQPYQGHSAYQTARELRKLAQVEAFVPLATYPRWFRPKNFPYFRADPNYSPPEIQTRYLEYPAIPGISRILNGYMCERKLAALKAFPARPDSQLLALSGWLRGCKSCKDSWYSLGSLRHWDGPAPDSRSDHVAMDAEGSARCLLCDHGK